VKILPPWQGARPVLIARGWWTSTSMRVERLSGTARAEDIQASRVYTVK
jgi:hypothetical protein